MLDSETRRRIDSARDILVGKVPDPKSQVEQITIALIYKFMDDMDKQSVEMGGKASFFKGEFKKYGWSEIFNPRMGGVEMLNLYGEAITRMSQNANLPELFRNIFKNAFLPYRDPETLKLFLKTINEFTYDHSEKLGDAFEYLLSVLGSQGDAGQFRTPRHIIDFMVRVLAPQKNETVLDPACGTAGFLISAYKYILKSNQAADKPLTTQEKQRLYENFTGYDISPDMVRLSLVNLYLHGFVKPRVHEYDTLTSEERWNEYADVILANPPFMSPKGGIKPHKRFSVQSNRSEVLFVDYMAEHLTTKGRAAIIVPEGIIFQSAGAYKQLRKYLVEQNYLWAVISLPAGVFNPYAGVKTSILFLDRNLAKKTDQILFVKVEADGFDLGSQRRPIDRNDLPDALNILNTWKHVVASGAKQSADTEGVAYSASTMSSQSSLLATTSKALLVSTSRLAENDDYNLSADRYREVTRVGKQTYPLIGLGEICEIISGQSPEGKYYNEEGKGVPFYQGKTEFTERYLGEPTTWTTNVTKIAEKDDILMSVRAPVGPVNIATQKICVGRGLAAIRPDTSKVLMEYVFINLKTKQDDIKGNSGSTFASINRSDIAKIQIPLPPLEIQRQIVEEITAHQRIIDGARQVVEGWKPDLKVELSEYFSNGEENFPCQPLGETVKIVAGFSFSSRDFSKKNPVKSIKITNVGVQEFIETEDNNLPREFTKTYSDYLSEEGDIAISLTRSIISSGFKFALVPQSYANALLNQRVALIKQDNKSYDIKYIYYALATNDVYQYVLNKSRSLMQPNLSINDLKAMPIPLPPLEVQREIVARIEREHAIVEGNRELIKIYEEKIKKVIEKVWEG